jgi:hypothetical protein
MKRYAFKWLSLLGAAVFVTTSIQAETLTVIRASELKADRFLDAATLQTLQPGTQVQSVSMQAGWVQVTAGSQKGWVRAVALKGSSGAVVAAVTQIETGRSGSNNNMSTTGVRSIPKASRHALVIGIGEYSASGISNLNGVKHDMVSAKAMANTMSIPDSNITYLRDREASAASIRAAIADLNQRVRPGDRVFVYYSGHGTRWVDPQVDPNSCTEGLLASDGQALTNQEMSRLLTPLASKSDKLMVFYDACHSGGVANQPLRTRSLQNDSLILTPKFSSQVSSDICAKPANLKTRSISGEMTRQGIQAENIVSIAASRPDEVSFDDRHRGGLATTAWRDCLLGMAKDLDGSGSTSVNEITLCAQDKVSQSLSAFPDILGQHMTIGGNRDFVPATFSREFLTASLSSVTPALMAIDATSEIKPDANTTSSAIAVPVAPVSVAVVAPPPAASEPVLQSVNTQASSEPALPTALVAPATPAELLRQLHSQRDASRVLTIQSASTRLRINQDPLRLTINSPRDGYLYLILAGSDQNSLYVLYPNSVDGNNAIKAGESVVLPRSHWLVTAGGPKGVNTLVAIVTDSPRDLSSLKGDKAGPFVKTLLTPEGKSSLQLFLGNSENVDESVCQVGGRMRNLQVSLACSDTFASQLINIEEY